MRQTTVAGNVANANTPGYRAVDIEPFSTVLDTSPLTMSATSGADLSIPQAGRDDFRAVDENPIEQTVSGNTVNLEGEMVKLGDVTRDFNMTANIQRAFHQFMLSALK